MPDMLVRLYDLPEIAMAEYLAGLNASVFVMDYDHNAPDAAYLKETHERLYRIYRSKNPAVPIIMVSRPDFASDPHSAGRREVIRHTYESARKRGDENVYFVDGSSCFGDMRTPTARWMDHIPTIWASSAWRRK